MCSLTIQRGTKCIYGTARIKDVVLPNPEYLPTTIFYFDPVDKSVSFWHNTLIGHVRKNMITIIGSSKNREGTLVIFTEKVTKSFRQWCIGKPLTKKANDGSLTKKAKDGISLPVDGMLQAMRGTLAGIYQGIKLGAHADVDLDTIFFVDGVMKVSKLKKIKPPYHPITAFAVMIRDLLGSDIPEELIFFLHLLKSHYVEDEFLRQLTKHPSLYKMTVKLDYISEAELLVKSLNTQDQKKLSAKFNSVQTEIQQLKNAIQQLKLDPIGEDWTQKIRRIHKAGTFLDVLNYSKYAPTPLDFLRYRWNVHQHPGILSAEELEAGLVNIWADFIHSMHEALRRCSIFIKLTDEMDNVPH